MNNETPRAARKDRAAREQTRHRLLAHLERLLPDPGQAEAFRAAMEMPPAPSLRVNSLVPQARLLAAALAARACRGAPAAPGC